MMIEVETPTARAPDKTDKEISKEDAKDLKFSLKPSMLNAAKNSLLILIKSVRLKNNWKNI